MYLETHGLLIEGVFRVNGDLKKAEQLLEAFASKSNVDLESLGDDGSSVRTVASLLKMYVETFVFITYEIERGVLRMFIVSHTHHIIEMLHSRKYGLEYNARTQVL